MDFFTRKKHVKDFFSVNFIWEKILGSLAGYFLRESRLRAVEFDDESGLGAKQFPWDASVSRNNVHWASSTKKDDVYVSVVCV